MSVTFDTNTLQPVVVPPADDRGKVARAVQSALRAGRIRGFYSETVVTLEGINNAERSAILEQTRVRSESRATGPNSVEICVGVHHVRQPLHEKFSAMVEGANELGLSPLRAPARIGAYHATLRGIQTFVPPGGIQELVRRMEVVNAVATDIDRRKVGHFVAQALGLQFSRRAGVGPELWVQGLGRAANDQEKKQVARAVAEWADGDTVAAHIGFGIDLLCTEDRGRSSRGPSIFEASSRRWLNEKYAVRFATLAELAAVYNPDG